MSHWYRAALAALALGTGTSAPLASQVMLVPPSVTPASWERFALRVANQSDTPTVVVRLRVPPAVQILGVAAPAGWSARLLPAGDTSAAGIEWSGGRLGRGEFEEFAFLGRVAGDARPGAELIFPVEIMRAGGSTVTWSREGKGRPPTVAIRGATTISAAGAFALAGAALGLAILALAVASLRKR
jgi:uncharacterized protein YcnI